MQSKNTTLSFKIIFHPCFSIIASLLFLSCATTDSVKIAQTRKENQTTSSRQTTSRQECFDIYAFGGDDWTPCWNPKVSFIQRIHGKKPLNFPTSKSSPEDAEEQSSDQLKRPELVDGFRVQLVNVTDETVALKVKERALALFDSVYVTFQRPNYKVRVGDFLTRAKADAAADSAKIKGFPDAWVVPAKVYLLSHP